MILGISGFAGSGKSTMADILSRNFHFIGVSLADPLKRMAREAFDFSEEQLWGPSEKRNEPDKRYPRAHTWDIKTEWDVTEDLKGFAEKSEASCACCGTQAIFSRHADGYDIIDPNKSPPCFLTPRHALQRLGTEWGRACYPNVWVDITMRTAKLLLVSQSHQYSRTQGAYPLHREHKIRGVAIPDVRFKNEMEAIRANGGKLIRIKRPNALMSPALAKHPSEEEQSNIPDDYFDGVIENDDTIEALQEKVLAMYDSLV